jgi:hypothetical protein
MQPLVHYDEQRGSRCPESERFPRNIRVSIRLADDGEAQQSATLCFNFGD